MYRSVGVGHGRFRSGSQRRFAGASIKAVLRTVSRYAWWPLLRSSIDGCVTKDVQDAAILPAGVERVDHRDSTSVPHPVAYPSSPEISKAIKLGLVREYSVGDLIGGESSSGRRRSAARKSGQKSWKSRCRIRSTLLPLLIIGHAEATPTWPI